LIFLLKIEVIGSKSKDLNFVGAFTLSPKEFGKKANNYVVK